MSPNPAPASSPSPDDPRRRNFLNRGRDLIFRSIHKNVLIYNTSWEDPAIDRVLLDLGPESRVVMITSAGDNALSYLLDRPGSIDSVDVNPRQNALFELKRAVIQHGSYEDLYAMFGAGYRPDFSALYHEKLRQHLPPYAREYWDKNTGFFERRGLKKSFYYHGGAGTLAWLCQGYFWLHRRLRDNIRWLFSAKTLEEQRAAWERVEPLLWNRAIRWVLGRHVTLAAMGVPRAQRDLIMNSFQDGLLGFLRTNVRRVFTEIPVQQNYFWRVYAMGSYSEECAPEYLRRGNFDTLQETLNRVTLHTSTMSEFLRKKPGRYSHFILLDHQDWLAWNSPTALAEEWRLILQNSTPGTKILMRSAGPTLDFLPEFVRQAVEFSPERTQSLHAMCRVGTYGSLHFGVVRA